MPRQLHQSKRLLLLLDSGDQEGRRTARTRRRTARRTQSEADSI
jgi:hypothetical protein